ncbi:MAG TPA: hypothetical protein VH880_11210 [Anaeromyxobacteraceae bacterium]|jgi:hypothetical protein
MTRIEAGTAAKAGYYLNTRTWQVHPVAKDGERLPGEPGEKWMKVPVLAALALAPVLGLAFLVFLPFIGFYLTGEAALRPVLRAFRREAGELAATMAPGWQPGEAHLTGRHEESAPAAAKGPPPEAPGKEPLEELAKEIEERRAAEARKSGS